MQSIILVTHCADLGFSDVWSAVDCVQLALSISYGLYIFVWEEAGEAALCVCGISGGSERGLWLWLTCRHGSQTSHQMLRCQPNMVFWDRYPYSVNHGPSLNCSPMRKCMRHLIKALWWRGAHAKSRNVYSVPGFEMRTCSPLVRVCEMRESTAAVK